MNPNTKDTNTSDSGVRLNKFLASCGLGSRRGCDLLIQNGDVVVNGSVCTNPGTRITSDDFVKVDGKRVQSLESETIILNKPKGLVCTKNDELERETIFNLLPPKLQHLNHVGRLDKESEGLLIMTNDGELAYALTHPAKKVEKEYLVTVDQAFDNDVLTLFLKGVHTPEGKAKAKSIKRLSPRRVKIILETGLKRQIRLMFAAVHLQVKKLVRVRIGNFTCNDLELGGYRLLESNDINALLEAPQVREKDQDRLREKKREAEQSGKRISQHKGYQGNRNPEEKNTTDSRDSRTSKKTAKKQTRKSAPPRSSSSRSNSSRPTASKPNSRKHSKPLSKGPKAQFQKKKSNSRRRPNS